MSVSFLLRRDVFLDWQTKNPVLRQGEQGYEIDTRRYKIGDGYNHWNDLPYFIDETTTLAYIEAEVAELAGTVTGVTEQEFDDHVNSELPHPVYEDGADLTLLYENAKV